MNSSYEFTHAITRKPGRSVVNGLRDTSGSAGDLPDPDPELFFEQHMAYLQALRDAGLIVETQDASEEFPDSVFVEDAALCIGNLAIVLRPGAESRSGEAALIRPVLLSFFDEIVDLPEGHLDGGDVLVGEDVVFAGLSSRTDAAGIAALESVVSARGYRLRQVDTPSTILHFKTECGLLDERTVFATRKLADTGCFKGFDIVTAPDGEEAAANLIRVNDVVLISAGFPLTRDLLERKGYRVVEIDTSEAAKVDGGLSCMSLRFNQTYKLPAASV